MMNPVPWLQMTNMISYQGLVRTFPNLNFITQQSRLLSANPAGPGRLHLFFVTFTAGIIVAAEKYQPFVLVPHRDVKTVIVNK